MRVHLWQDQVDHDISGYNVVLPAQSFLEKLRAVKLRAESCLHGMGYECGPCSLAEVKYESENPRTRSRMHGSVVGGFSTVIQPSTRNLAVVSYHLRLS